MADQHPFVEKFLYMQHSQLEMRLKSRLIFENAIRTDNLYILKYRNVNGIYYYA